MNRKIVILTLSTLALSTIGLWILMTRSCGFTSANGNAIPQCLLLPQQGLAVLQARISGQGIEPAHGLFQRYQPVENSQTISHAPLPVHPFMGTGGNNMHNDAYVSDVNAGPGPLGLRTRVQSRTQGFGGYGTLTFDRQGRIVAVYGNAREFQLELLDADSLDELASYDLPPRSLYFPLQGVMPWKYLGAGMYFYLDEQDRVILPSTRNTLMVIQTPEKAEDGFQLIREYDLSEHVMNLPWPKLDSVAWVMPEWPERPQTEANSPDTNHSKRYWYATIAGMVGVIDAESGAVSTWKAPDEIIENSFAVGEEGIFMMTDQAMYRLAYAQERIQVQWRTSYDRGPAQKAGHITRGSGTSVTLVGTPEQGLVVATDNAEPHIHLELYQRTNGEKVCRVPLFAAGKSGTDLSALAFQHADELGTPLEHYSVMVENNYGHHVFPTPDPHPGIARVDIHRDANNHFTCKQIWQTREAGIAGAKLSLAAGLLYMATTDKSPAMGNYFTAIDFRDGSTVFRQHTGLGHGYNNWQGVLFLHPNNGALYGTSIFGLVKIQDQVD